MTEDLKLPEFDYLVERLMDGCSTIELQPYELVQNGRAMRLIPARGGVPMKTEYVDINSLPVLDLAKAGINWNQHADTIKTAIAQLLAGHTFVIAPSFDPVAVSAITPTMAAMIDAQALNMEMKHRFSFGPDPSEAEIRRELLEPLNKGMLGFVIGGGDGVPGLDLSGCHIIGTFVSNIHSFVMPTFKDLQPESPLGTAFSSAVSLVRAHMKLDELEEKYAVYLEYNSTKWHFRFFNWKWLFESTLKDLRVAMQRRLEAFNGAMAAV